MSVNKEKMMDMKTTPQVEKKMRVSQKKKWILGLSFLLGFYIGLHALYAGRIRKGAFYLLGLSGVFLYYGYIIYFLSHNWLTAWLKFSSITWFAIYTTIGSIVQHIPFLGWTSFFGSYLIYLFAFALFLSICDFFSIIFGRFKDSHGLPIVSERYKRKHADDILFY